MGVSGLGLEGLTSDSAGGGGIPSSPHLLQNFGVVGAPELAFDGDQDTGLYRPAVNTLGLVAGGVELARISATGNAFLQAGTDPAGDGGDLDLGSGDSGVGATGNGGDVNVLAGSSVATTGDGGIVSIKGGAGFFQGAGGSILQEVGAGGAAGPGTSGDYFVNTTVGLTADAGLQVPIPGLVSIYGIGRSGSGPAGDLELWGGYAAGAGGGSIGGDLLLFGGGQGGGAGEGGNAHLYGGESDTQPGFAEVEGGTATVNGPGGLARVVGGPGFGTNEDGGTAALIGGAAIGTGLGGPVLVTGGASGAGASGLAGPVTVKGGAASATNVDGGAVSVEGGDASNGGDGGSATLEGGAGNATNAGGQANVTGGVSGAGATGDGGTVAITGGASAATNGGGGAVIIGSGAGAGAGADGDIFLDLAGVTQFRVSSVGLHSEVGSGPALLNVGASATVPVLIPNQAENDTGYTRSGVDQLSHTLGGVEALRCRSTTNTLSASSNLAVWSYDESALLFIQFGADDSAGSGFKTCRVTN